MTPNFIFESFYLLVFATCMLGLTLFTVLKSSNLVTYCTQLVENFNQKKRNINIIGHSQQEENMRRIQSVGGVITSGSYWGKESDVILSVYT